jgi:hypothetical protein
VLSSTNLIAAALAQELCSFSSSSHNTCSSSSSSSVNGDACSSRSRSSSGVDSYSRTSSSSSNNDTSCSSFWGPYYNTLPTTPASPWLLTEPHQVAASIAPYAASQGPAAVARWEEATATCRQELLETSQHIAELLQPSDPGAAAGPDVRQVLEALGHVRSRMLSSSTSSGLLPFIDLLNHGPGAAAPMLQLDDNDNLVITVLPIRNVSLSQGSRSSCQEAICSHWCSRLLVNGSTGQGLI